MNKEGKGRKISKSEYLLKFAPLALAKLNAIE
jgi:hypothetical protein